jgi:lysophospholipase L1-like esterase
MKKYRILCCIIILIIITLCNYSQNYHVRIGFIGNSITQGVGLPDPETQCFSAQLAGMLPAIYGDTCIVKNFGITTTTMLKNGDVSYWNSTQFNDCMDYAAEICVILLGTNDSKPQNWDVYGDKFIDDYLSMIDTIKTRNPFTKFIVCYPPPAYEIVWDIRDSVIKNGVIPGVDSVLAKTGAGLIDFYHPLLDSVSLFPDKIHPNARGSKAMAEIVLGRLIEMDIVHKADTGLTFVTSFKTGSGTIAVRDSAFLSWTTINADSAFLNGLPVSVNGNIKVSPPVTTTYILKAKGKRNTDSLKLVQEVYRPELSRLRINPKKKTLQEGDSIFLQLYYHDQLNNIMTDTTFDIQWSITGKGYLIDETDVSVVCVTSEADTLEVTARYDTLMSLATIIIKAVNTGINESSIDRGIKVFPNPCEGVINIIIEIAEPSAVTVRIFNMKGVLYKNSGFYFSKAGQQDIRLKTDDLADGTYIIEIEHSGRLLAEKIFVNGKH